MKRAFFLCAAVLVFAPAAAMAQPWSDNFDGYPNGQDLHGVGGWLGWDGDAGATAFVTADQSSSAPHSLAITGPSDLVQEYSTDGTGVYFMSTDTYLPSGSSGTQWFIMLNRYSVGGGKNWSTQTQFNNTTGLVHEADGGIGDSVDVPIVYDEWVPLVMEINLDANTVSLSYNGTPLYTDQDWMQSGDLDIGAVDLFGNGASVMYYDNMVLTPEPTSLVLLALGGVMLLRRRR